jgi:hypothetical protein
VFDATSISSQPLAPDASQPRCKHLCHLRKIVAHGLRKGLAVVDLLGAAVEFQNDAGFTRPADALGNDFRGSPSDNLVVQFVAP